MFTTAVKNQIMNTIFNGSTTSLPATFTIGLSTSAPNASGGNISEPATSTGYKRVTGVKFSSASSGKISNAALIEFPTFTKAAGTLTHYVLYHPTTGTMYWAGKLKASRTIEADTVVSFPVGNLVIELQDALE